MHYLNEKLRISFAVIGIIDPDFLMRSGRTKDA